MQCKLQRVALVAAGLCWLAASGALHTVSAQTTDTILPPPRPAELDPRTVKQPLPPAPSATAAPVTQTPSPTAAAPATPEATCLRRLAAIQGNIVRSATKPAAPGKATAARRTDTAGIAVGGGCEVVEPVIVEALSVRTPDGPAQVRLNPPPTVSCDLAQAFAEWLDSGLQPLARGSFGQELTSLRVGGGHECRRRNRQATTPVSEHATGRALDIFAFQVGSAMKGTTISVEKPSGLAQTRFLEAVRDSACGAFSTVLGPGSDAAHENHLHVDIQQRRTGSTRFCQ